MRITYLKIPRRLHKFCKEKSSLNEIVTFYQFKIINSNGYFKKSDIIERMITTGICTSESSGYYKISKCVKLGVLERTKNGYQVVSYDKMFEILGYSVEYNYKRRRKGFFKIYKIKELCVSSVKDWIQYVDIRDNLRKQRLNLFKLLKNHKTHPVSLNHKTQSSCRERLEQFVGNDPVQIYDDYRNDLDGYIYTLLSGGDYKREINPDITLSLKGVVRVLGLSNVSSARNILNNLQDKLFLTVEKRLVETESISKNLYYKIIDGKRYANLPNKLHYLR